MSERERARARNTSSVQYKYTACRANVLRFLVKVLQSLPSHIRTINEIIIYYYHYLDTDNGGKASIYAGIHAFCSLNEFGKSSFLFDLTAVKFQFPPHDQNPRVNRRILIWRENEMKIKKNTKWKRASIELQLLSLCKFRYVF